MNAEARNQEIARYREAAPGLRREFVLYPGKVSIRGRRIGGDDFEVHVPLAELSPEFGRVHFRALRFYYGVMLFIGLSVFLWLFLRHFGLPLHSSRVIVTAVFAGACLLWCVLYFPKYRSYQFVNRAGVIVLNCIEAGSERDRCRDFAETISRTIRETDPQQEATS